MPPIADPSGPLAEAFVERGDLAHLALLMWAIAASLMAAWAVRALAESNRRYADFVAELALLNESLAGLAKKRREKHR